MVLPTILKKRHSLRGRNLLPLIRRIKAGTPDNVKEFARLCKEKKIDDLDMDELAKSALSITGEKLPELLELAGKDALCIEDARWALHSIIVYTNEAGQPNGQDLSMGTATTDMAIPGTCSGNSDDRDEPPQKKKKDAELVDRIASMVEESTNQSKIEVIADLKEKVRTLCLQSDPNDSLILLTLEDLARMARKISHQESNTFQELARQANRYQSKLDIPSFCLSVLGGKAADAVTKAMSKCFKDKLSDVKVEKRSQKGEMGNDDRKPEQSPLANLYPSFQVPYMYPPVPGSNFGVPGMYPSMNYGNAFPQSNYRYTRPGGYRSLNFRPRGACLFCDSPSHHIRDCVKMKTAKGK